MQISLLKIFQCLLNTFREIPNSLSWTRRTSQFYHHLPLWLHHPTPLHQMLSNFYHTKVSPRSSKYVAPLGNYREPGCLLRVRTENTFLLSLCCFETLKLYPLVPLFLTSYSSLFIQYPNFSLFIAESLALFLGPFPVKVSLNTYIYNRD